jgi:hypothetical protein
MTASLSQSGLTAPTLAPSVAGYNCASRSEVLRRRRLHALAHAVANAEAVLVSDLKASKDLRAELDLDRGDYRGQFVYLVDTSLKAHVKDVRLRVETALAARHELERRFGELDDVTRASILRIIEGGYVLDKYEEQLLDCPVRVSVVE